MVKIAKEFVALILAWLLKDGTNSQPTPKPSDILADVVAAKILTDIQYIEKDWSVSIGDSDFMILSWIVKGVSVRSHFSFSGGTIQSVLVFDMSIKGKLIAVSDQSQEAISQALYDGFNIKAAQKKAKDDADNEFNALDALTDIFNIGKEAS